MSVLSRLLGSSRKYSAKEVEELEEWDRHHNDPRSRRGETLLAIAREQPDLTLEQLRDLWVEANALVGQRAPADYGEFLAYGYLEGRRDAITNADAAASAAYRAGLAR